MTEENKPWVKQREKMKKWFDDNVEVVEPTKVPKPYLLDKKKESKEKYVNEEDKDE